MNIFLINLSVPKWSNILLQLGDKPCHVLNKDKKDKFQLQLQHNYCNHFETFSWIFSMTKGLISPINMTEIEEKWQD